MHLLAKKIMPNVGLLSVAFLIILWGLGIPFAGVADEQAYLHYGINSVSNVVGPVNSIQQSTLKNISGSPCFAFHAEITANCQNFLTKNGETNAKSPMPRYPRIWFYLSAWPAILFSGQLGLVMAKLLASLLSIGLLFIAVANWQRDKRAIPAILLLSLPPLSIQMLGSYNPNGFEIAGITSLAIVLFGQKPGLTSNRRSWWFSVVLLSFLAASAKPMSGILVFAVYLGYFALLAISNEEYSKWVPRIKHLGSRVNVKLMIIATTTLGYSYLLSLPSLIDSSKIVQPTNSSMLHTLLSFLFGSEGYAQEYAGMFGWRDIRSAPWGVTFWTISLAILIFLSFQRRNRQVITFISLVWLIVLIIAPAIETISLSRNYNVGLQTRYLGGIYAFGVVLTSRFIEDFYEKTRYLIPILLILNLVEFVWVYLRFALGFPTYLNQPHAFFDSLTSTSTWRPMFIGLVILLMGILISLTITQIGNNAEKLTKTKLYICTAVCLTAAIIGASAQLAYKNYTPQHPEGTVIFDVGSASSPVGEISKNRVIEQSFVPLMDGLNTLKIELATYARTNSGKLEFEVLDSRRNTIFSKEVFQKNILDNSFYEIDFPTQHHSAKQKYFLVLTGKDSPPGHSITAWAGSQTPMKGFTLKIDGKTILQTLSFKGYSAA